MAVSVNTPQYPYVEIPLPGGGLKKQAVREVTYQGPNPQGVVDSLNATAFDLAYLESAEIEVDGEGLTAYYDNTDATIKVEATDNASGMVRVTALGT